MKSCKPLLGVAAVIIVVLASSLVRVENQRYAMSVGMCRIEGQPTYDPACLEKVQTRTSWIWHIYYAVSDK